VNAEVADRLRRLRGVSLSELDERASLLQRVDRKYALPAGEFPTLLDRLGEDHEVLEIDERRCFSYRTAYFDTPDLRCFWDHVNGRTPRFKARTRLYEDTSSCVFEVKLKSTAGETDKRQIDHPPDQSDVLTESAIGCVREALYDVCLSPPGSMVASLETTFRRVTLAARDSSERITCDFGVSLSCSEGGTAAMSESIVLLETKTEHGDGRADRALAQLGIGEISLSKYRVGISIASDASPGTSQPGSEHFRRV